MRAHVLAIGLLVPLAFLPVLSNGWVPWDDPEAIVDNDRLREPGLVGWAFTTSHMSHFQPLSWLAWAGVERAFGASPRAFHAASLLVHAVNAVLLYLLIVRLTASGTSSVLTSLLYALHPLRVEPVAWASAFPYLLATMFLLASALFYLRSRLVPSAAAYAASLLARPVALGFPVVLLALDLLPLRRERGARPLAEKAPFFALALAGLVLESSRRSFVGLDRIGLGARFTLASESAVAHFTRLVWPVRLTPLDPLPIEPQVDPVAIALGALVVLGSGALAWRFRPAALIVWASWLVLVLPSLGLAPSGLQATADRYGYVPGLALAAGLGALLARSSGRARAATAGVVAVLAVLSYRQALWWSDSVTLWGRAVELNAEDDLALYFYASALNEAGRSREAMAAYEHVLRVVPEHGPARRDLAWLAAREADVRAQRGALREAIELYDAALRSEPTFAAARENRAMALFQLGRRPEALVSLRDVAERGASRPELYAALAALERAEGEIDEAVSAIEVGLERFPGDVALLHDLARTLATRADVFPDRRAEALALAERVVSRTSRADPRALDTLAIALAVNGAREAALAAFEEASRRARTLGDETLAREIDAHASRIAR